MKHRATIFAIVTYALLSFNFQCGKEDMGPMKIEEVSQFEIPLDIYPVKKIYTPGDTIWIKGDLADKILWNTKSDRSIKTDSVQFNIPFLFKVLNKQVLVPNGGFCEFINPDQLSMSTSPGYYDPRYNVYWNYNAGTVLNYGCIEKRLPFKIGIKLKCKGAFYIGLSNSSLITCADKPGTVQNKHLSFNFNTTDMNSDVYHNLPKLAENDPYWIGFDVNLLNERKAFIVRVD